MATDMKFPWRILIYWPDEVALSVLRPFVEAFASLDVFSDGNTALSALSKNNYDVVLIDKTCPSTINTEIIQMASSKSTSVKSVGAIWNTRTDIDAHMWNLDADNYFNYSGHWQDAMTVALYSLFTETTGLKWFTYMQSECHGMRERIEKNGTQTVLLTGSAGTGKYTLAQIAHIRSNRANNRFVFVNCKAVENSRHPVWTEETERHFTGILMEIVRTAQGGTLYFHEIDHLDIRTQKLVADLLNKELRVNTPKSRFNGSIICSTRINIEDKIADHECVDELILILRKNVIKVPSLLDFNDDIGQMLEYILRYYCLSHNIKPKAFTRAAVAKLTEYTWPRNLREMFDVIRHAVYMTKGKWINEDAIRLFPPVDPDDTSYDKMRKVKNALVAAKGRVTKAAEILGIAPKTMYEWMKKINLPGEYCKRIREQVKLDKKQESKRQRKSKAGNGNASHDRNIT